MNVIQVPFYFHATNLSGSIQSSTDADIKSIKEQFSKIFFNCFSKEEQFYGKRLVAYDSYKKSFNITALLNDKTTLDTLKTNGFSFETDYIGLEYV